MERQLLIRDVYAREILDSRGNPAIEAEVLAGEDVVGRASVPSGAFDRRDNESEPWEKGGCRDCGIRQAVENINSRAAEEIIGRNVFCQAEIDRALLRTAGGSGQSAPETNALLSVSIAAARAAGKALKLPLYRYLGGVRAVRMPMPVMNIMNTGACSDIPPGIREFMIVPSGGERSFCGQLRMCTEVCHSLEQILKERGYSAAVGDDGAFFAEVRDVREVFRMIRDAAERRGYHMGKELWFALGASAPETYDPGRQAYVVGGEKQSLVWTTEEMIRYYEELISEFPVWSLEDPLDREDWGGWQTLTRQAGNRVQLVGNTLFASDAERIKKGRSLGAANAVMVRVDRISTLSGVFKVIRTAQESGYRTVIARSPAETEDTFIADIAAAFNTGQIKAGAPCRSEQTSKYNRLIRIGEKIEGPEAERD